MDRGGHCAKYEIELPVGFLSVSLVMLMSSGMKSTVSFSQDGLKWNWNTCLFPCLFVSEVGFDEDQASGAFEVAATL
ncbi:hypothetical protein Tco_0565594 [Tanacetum coccineum]